MILVRTDHPYLRVGHHSRFSSGVTKMCCHMNRKLLAETVETGLSSLTNQMVRFCQFRWQSGAPPALDEEASPTKRRLNEG
jgi:hypothetical protein